MTEEIITLVYVDDAVDRIVALAEAGDTWKLAQALVNVLVLLDEVMSDAEESSDMGSESAGLYAGEILGVMKVALAWRTS
jgi:hypothetical protein